MPNSAEEWLDRAAYDLTMRNSLIKRGASPKAHIVLRYEEIAANNVSRAKAALRAS